MAYKIAILVGSLRKEILNRRVAKSICALRGDNLDCTMVDIGNLPLYSYDYDTDYPPKARELKEAIAGVHALGPNYAPGSTVSPHNAALRRELCAALQRRRSPELISLASIVSQPGSPCSFGLPSWRPGSSA